MVLENDCFGDYADYSKKTDADGKVIVNEKGEPIRDEKFVCTCREYCTNQSGEYLPAFMPVKVPFGDGVEIYDSLPKCLLYSMDSKPKVRKIRKSKVSAPEKNETLADKINAESNVSTDEKCNADQLLLKRIKEIIGEVKK